MGILFQDKQRNHFHSASLIGRGQIIERLAPILEEFLSPREANGSHKSCLPLTQRWKRMAMYSYTSSDIGKNE